MDRVSDKVLASGSPHLLRVFSMPAFNRDFVFGKSVPYEFRLCDWFHVPELEPDADLEVVIRNFIRYKPYYNPQQDFLILGMDTCFVIGATE